MSTGILLHSPSEIPLARFQRSEDQEIRVRGLRWRKRKYLDIRLWVRGADGTWHPTKFGCRLKESELERLGYAIEALRGWPVKSRAGGNQWVDTA